MEDFVVDQARYLSRILAANAKHIADKRVVSEQYSVHPMSVMDHAEILQVAVGDSVTLHKECPQMHQFVVSKSEFSLLQNQLLGLALQDHARLQDAAADSISEVLSIRPAFILEVAEILESVLRDNAEAATEGNFDISKLGMCQPWEVAKLVKRLRHLLEYHIRHLESLTRSNHEADAVAAELRKENEDLAAQYTSAQTRITELEGAMTAARLKNEQDKAASDAADAGTQARIDTLTRLLQMGHLQCVQKIQERDSEIAQLREDLQKHADVAAERTAAQTRIAELEGALGASQRQFELAQTATMVADAATQARIDKITNETKLLQSAHLECANKLQERDSEIAQLKEECKRLIRSYEDRVEAANDSVAKVAVKVEELELVQMERDKLATDLSELQASHEEFCLVRAEESRKLVMENTQLQEALQKQVDASETAETRNTELRREVSRLESELRTSQTQLMGTEVQCDTYKVTLEDVLVRHATELDEARQKLAEERELREAGDVFLQKAVRKIEDLEQSRREQDQEIVRLHEAVAQMNSENSQRQPVPPPPSANKAGPSWSRKRKATAATWSQDDTGFALNLAAHGSPIPPARAAGLASLPAVTVKLGDSPEIFTRQSLSNILGGSIQGLVVRCTQSATDLARRYDISDYLCPNMDHNAWSPPGPGQHGYMQVGLGRDRKLFNGEGEYRHVFVGGGKFFLYCGWYHVLRVDPLTKEEWDTLPKRVKTTYSETTFNKENTKECTNKQLWSTIKNADQVLAMYNNGELRAPLVRLQCLKFDMDFYQELVDANSRYFTNKARPAPPNAAKRRKAADDKEEDDSLAEIGDKTEENQPAMPQGDSATSAPGPSNEAMASSSSGNASMDASVAMAPPDPNSEASASIVLPPSTPSRQGGHGSAPRFSSGLLRLRIPGGRSPRSHRDPKDTEDEREVEDRLSSSGLSSVSDDDDLYAD